MIRMRRVFAAVLAAVAAAPAVLVLAPTGAAAASAGQLREAAEQLAFGAPRLMADVYGGVYGDQGRIKLAVTDPEDSRVRWVEDGFPYAGQLDVVVVDRTLSDLARLTDRIDEESVDLVAMGIDLAAWGPDLKANRVEIQVENLEFWEAVELVTRYGVDWVSVVEGERNVPARCDSREYCPTLRAGLEIELSELEGACTSGFQARLALTDVPVMLTAGHCAPTAGAALHRLQPVGPVLRNAFEPVPSVGTTDATPSVPVWRTKVDALAIQQIEAAGVQGEARGFAYPWLRSASIYIDDLNKERSVGSVFSGTHVPGVSQVCALGASSALVDPTPEDCGAVSAAAWTFMWGTVGDAVSTAGGGGRPVVGLIQIEDQVAAALCARLGDSGGPVYTPGGGTGAAVAHGMISSVLGCSPGTERITFTPIAVVQSALGVQVRTQ